MTVAGASVPYMAEVVTLLSPSPSAWPSSCVTVVWKSYWPEPICVASAPAYQFQPWISVIWPVVL